LHASLPALSGPLASAWRPAQLDSQLARVAVEVGSGEERRWLVLGVAGNLAVIGWFKYSLFLYLTATGGAVPPDFLRGIVLPLDVAAELAAQADRPTFRRLAGITSIYTVEALIVVILITAVGRIGLDFVEGHYEPAGLFVTVVELVSILLIIGYITASLFFPPLRQRLRRTVAQRARSLVTATVKRAQGALREHVEAVDRLAREGRDLLLLIDQTVLGLAAEASDKASVNQLFGQTPQFTIGQETTMPSVPVRHEGQEPARGRPTFD